MDALKMVTLAKQWKRVPDQKRCEISSSVSKKKVCINPELNTIVFKNFWKMITN